MHAAIYNMYIPVHNNYRPIKEIAIVNKNIKILWRFYSKLPAKICYHSLKKVVDIIMKLSVWKSL